MASVVAALVVAVLAEVGNNRFEFKDTKEESFLLGLMKRERFFFLNESSGFKSPSTESELKFASINKKADSINFESAFLLSF